MERIISRLAVACAVIVSLVSCSEKQQQASGPKQVLLATARYAEGGGSATYPGRTRASETSSVAFRVSGTLASVPVSQGDYVRRGQVVARIDDRDYRTQLAATEAEYAQIEAEAGRVIALYADSATSQNNYDKARYGLGQITQKLKNHRDQVADCVLTAPYDGYVESVLHEAHETVGAGMPVLTMFAAGGVEVVINIPTSEYMKRDDFGQFTAAFDVLPGRTFPLTLRGISRRANANQLYEVRLAIADGASAITPGMSTTVTLRYAQDGSRPVVVPSSALLRDSRGTAVFVYDDGRLRRTPVEVAFLHSDGTVELASGVADGEQVVSSGVRSLHDGDEVRPFPRPSDTNVGGLL